MERADNPDGNPSALPSDFPDDFDTEAREARDRPSLLEDIDSLFTDGRTYLEAEITFQKSRAGFTANRLKWSVVFGAAAFGLVHLALIALTVGTVIALAPLVGPWVATAGVVLILLVLAAFCVFRLRAYFGDIRSVFQDGEA